MTPKPPTATAPSVTDMAFELWLMESEDVWRKAVLVKIIDVQQRLIRIEALLEGLDRRGVRAKSDPAP